MAGRELLLSEARLRATKEQRKPSTQERETSMRIVRIIAASITKQPSRPEHGCYESAIEIEVGGRIGLAHFYYEWDKRDVLVEELLVDPEIEAEALHELTGDCSPSNNDGIFGEMTTTGDQDELKKAREIAVAVVYSYD